MFAKRYFGFRHCSAMCNNDEFGYQGEQSSGIEAVSRSVGGMYLFVRSYDAYSQFQEVTWTLEQYTRVRY